MDRNDPSNAVNEGPPKKKERFELTETFVECFWDQDSVLSEYANTYKGKFESNQTLINKILLIIN